MKVGSAQVSNLSGTQCLPLFAKHRETNEIDGRNYTARRELMNGSTSVELCETKAQCDAGAPKGKPILADSALA